MRSSYVLSSGERLVDTNFNFERLVRTSSCSWIFRCAFESLVSSPFPIFFTILFLTYRLCFFRWKRYEKFSRKWIAFKFLWVNFEYHSEESHQNSNELEVFLNTPTWRTATRGFLMLLFMAQSFLQFPIFDFYPVITALRNSWIVNVYHFTSPSLPHKTSIMQTDFIHLRTKKLPLIKMRFWAKRPLKCDVISYFPLNIFSIIYTAFSVQVWWNGK